MNERVQGRSGGYESMLADRAINGDLPASRNTCIRSTTETKQLPYNVLYPTGNEQEYIPMLSFTGEDGTMDELSIILKAIDQDKCMGRKSVTSVYFMSPPGLGKTVLGGHLAASLKCPYQIINCVSTMADLDLLGSYVLIGQETIWQDGPLPSIVRATNENGMGILIINELNALSLNAQVALNPLMDKQQCVVLTLRNNEVVSVRDDAHLLIIASMNPDIMGVNELQDSVRDRSNLIIHMDYPSVDKEAELVNRILDIPIPVARQFTSVISECRQLKTRDHKITRAPSIRGLLDWINYTRAWGAGIAFQLTIVNKYGTTEEEKNALNLIGRGKGVSSLKVPPPSRIEAQNTSREDNDKKQAVHPGTDLTIAAQAFALYKNGVEIDAIAKTLSRSRTTIYRYLRSQRWLEDSRA